MGVFLPQFSLRILSVILLATFSTSVANLEKDLSAISIDDLYDRDVGLDPNTPPELLDFNKYRLNEERQRYFRVGETDSCTKNMRFFAVAHANNSKLGQCDCDWFQCSRPLLYFPVTGKCYLAWSRGPCKKGEWYTFGNGMLPICQRHPCPELHSEESLANFYFQNPKDGKCYQTGTRGYCENERDKLWIYPLQPIPECRNYTVATHLPFLFRNYAFKAIDITRMAHQSVRFHNYAVFKIIYNVKFMKNA